MYHLLVYGCGNRYEREPLGFVKQLMCNTEAWKDSFESHINYFKDCFADNHYSALHIMVMKLEPEKGITEVVLNEYAENALKQRIVINEKAKKPIGNKRRLTPAMIDPAPPEPEFWPNDLEVDHQ